VRKHHRDWQALHRDSFLSLLDLPIEHLMALV
jgi:hypothetical protein